MIDERLDWFWIMNLARLLIIIGIPWLTIRAAKNMSLTGCQSAIAIMIGLGIFYLELTFADDLDGPELPNGQRWLIPYIAIAIPISIWACALSGWRNSRRKNKIINGPTQ